MFDHDDGVVDDEPHGRRHAAKRHDVETHFQDVEQQNSGGEDRRHGKRCDQCHFQVAQKRQENDGGEHDADEDSVACAVFRCSDEIALIVPIGDLHSVRNLFLHLAQLSFDAAGDLDGVSGGLLVNLEEDSVMTVGRNPDPLRLGRMLDLRHVFEQDDAIGS